MISMAHALTQWVLVTATADKHKGVQDSRRCELGVCGHRSSQRCVSVWLRPTVTAPDLIVT